jgi:hypothetical protein
MVDPQVSGQGAPLGALIVGTGFALLVAGSMWMRRISSVEKEPKSFRATTAPSPLDRLTLGVALAAVVFAAVFALGALAT